MVGSVKGELHRLNQPVEANNPKQNDDATNLFGAATQAQERENIIFNYSEYKLPNLSKDVLLNSVISLLSSNMLTISERKKLIDLINQIQLDLNNGKISISIPHSISIKLLNIIPHIITLCFHKDNIFGGTKKFNYFGRTNFTQHAELLSKFLAKDIAASKIQSFLRNTHMRSQRIRRSEIPIRNKALDVGLEGEEPIGRGNHAQVYRRSKFVVKDLKDAKEIKAVREGISIICELAAEHGDLQQHNLVEERIIFDTPTHLQYTAIRMDGDATKIPRIMMESKKMTKIFARDASKAISFLNKNNIMYGNIKPENFLYKTTNRKVEFYLQDYGAIVKVKGGKIPKTLRCNTIINLNLCNAMFGYNHEYNRKIDTKCGWIQLLRNRNLSGLIFTIILFHIPQSNLRRFTESDLNIVLDELGIILPEDRILISKLCFGNEPLTIEELGKVEQIMNSIKT